MSYSRTFTNERIRIFAIGDSGIISDALFSECTIVGPAVLLVMDNTVRLENNAFAAISMDQVFWELPESRREVIGAIGLTNCRFEKCEMVRIGIAGPREIGELLGVPRSTTHTGPASQYSPPTPMGSFIEIGEGVTLTNAHIERNVMIGTSQGPVNIEGDRDAASDLIRELLQALPNSGLAEDRVHAVEDELAAAQAEVTSDSPRSHTIRQRLGKALRLIQSASEFTTASTGLIEAVDKAHRMLPGI